MSPISLIHITPELPPTIGGVADYTSILTKQLIEVSDGAVQPSMILAGWKVSDEKPNVDVSVEDLAGECSADRLAKTIQKLASQSGNTPIVLLQYSGYGYAKRGAPLWLLKGLQKVCGEKGIPLVTMFHELFATGKPWSSTFWVSPLQKYVASQLAKLSSVNVTNREQSADWLQNHIENKETVSVQPVFSNVGEPENLLIHQDREPYAVVFGGGKMKKRLYNNCSELLDKYWEIMGIEKIIDIGKTDNTFQWSKRIQEESLGIQQPSSISEYLLNARVGILDLSVDCLTKSGVYAAYAAHGIPTLVFSETIKSTSLREGHHYLRINDEFMKQITHGTLIKVGKNVFSWYQKSAHSRKVASEFYKSISKVT